MHIENIIDALMELPYSARVDKDHLTVRCPICGDSKKHHDKSHCVIWHKAEQPLIYHCWICENSGLVDNSFLSSLGINDLHFLNLVHGYNKQYSKSIANTKISQSGDILVPINIPKLIDSPKLEYIRNRLEVNFSTESLEYLRVISSIKDFLELNKLDIHPKYKNWIPALEKDYVGFLSSSKGHIIFRSINPNSKFRYVVYRVFQTVLPPTKFYTIPSKINIMEDKITLNISEGIFDILGVFFHVHNMDADNQIYAAVCGSGYKSVIEYFIKRGCIGNLNINIYSDLDKNKRFYSNLKSIKNWINDMDIYYNRTKGEKDFGVPRSKINPIRVMSL